jgi:hypothetical protein
MQHDHRSVAEHVNALTELSRSFEAKLTVAVGQREFRKKPAA